MQLDIGLTELAGHPSPYTRSHLLTERWGTKEVLSKQLGVESTNYVLQSLKDRTALCGILLFSVRQVFRETMCG